MAEQIDLTTPIQPPSVANYTVGTLVLDWTNARIFITLKDNNGVDAVFSYVGSQATNMMIALNKANLTNNSLQKRIFTQLIADGKLSGSVSGSPA